MADPIQDIHVSCGQFTEVTADHVIPQCLFPSCVPKNAPVVSACKACNYEKKSGNDTYLHDILVTNMHSVDTPIAQKLYPKFDRAVGRNQLQLAKDLQHGQILKRYTSQGITTALMTSRGQMNAAYEYYQRSLVGYIIIIPMRLSL
jgi:hypothetical protein